MPPLTGRLPRVAFYLASALVGALSLAPAAAVPPGPIHDKVEHIIAYAILGLLGGLSSKRSVLRTMLGLATFGIAIELLQTLSPGRSPDVFDALADLIGACAGCGAAAALRILTPSRLFGVHGKKPGEAEALFPHPEQPENLMDERPAADPLPQASAAKPDNRSHPTFISSAP